MAEHAAQYDHIGSRYDEYARTATLKRAEEYTFFRMVGPLHGERVLDLACGFGFYTRLLKQHGAGDVVGMDVSPEMIRLASETEHAESLGIAYQVADATALPPLEPFDLVTAVYLLNYAATREQLRDMLRSVYANLKPGGRFVAYTMDPVFTLAKPNATKYGGTVRRQQPIDGGWFVDSEFTTVPPTPFQYFQWSQATYEWAIREAGFADFRWHQTEVSPEDIATFGDAYWQDLRDNSLVIGLICRK